ncbi:transcriptional regulator [Kitasatospora sp. NPDC056181]|uniref:transcriptional regulator n=1 Tax=Kitasatospora sp. NPDC056181 TaxID=3345737 RepID=UPI0035E1AEDD
MPSGTLACPETGRHRRLAVQLSGMIPGAVTIRVSLNDPAAQWPHPYARATAADGKPIRVSRIKAGVAARWVLRTWPDADWTRPHTLDLSNGRLTAGTGAAVRSR